MIFTPRFAKKKETEESTQEEKEAVYYAQKKDEMPRLMGICGQLDEETAGEIMYGMVALYESGA